MRGWICRLQLLLVLASAVILTSVSRGTRDHILLSQIRDSLKLEDQVPLFISPRIRVARLYPQALGSLFVDSYDTLLYGGGIRPRIHTGVQLTTDLSRLYHLNTDRVENNVRCCTPTISVGTCLFAKALLGNG
jgi:hypothetical protein